MSIRTQRVGSIVRDVVADAILSRLNDPRIPALTSVTRVEVAADLSIARVHVSVMAEPAKRGLAVRALQSAAGRLRGMLRRRLSARTIPSLEFFLDESIQHGIETVNTLDRLMAESRPETQRPDGDETDETPESAADESRAREED